jgi:hypothetical protein
VRTLGKMTTVVMVALAGVSAAVIFRSIPDVQRYLKIRNM